jgi:hypothetical protein
MTTPTEPYRPSNGTEGEIFQHRFCDRCKHDAAFQADENAEGCPILALTLVFNEDEPEYPKEWVRDVGDTLWPGSARCTEFVSEDEADWPWPTIQDSCQCELPL